MDTFSIIVVAWGAIHAVALAGLIGEGWRRHTAGWGLGAQAGALAVFAVPVLLAFAVVAQ